MCMWLSHPYSSKIYNSPLYRSYIIKYAILHKKINKLIEIQSQIVALISDWYVWKNTHVKEDIIIYNIS